MAMTATELEEYKNSAQKYLDSLTGEEFKKILTDAGFEVSEGTGEIIITEQEGESVENNSCRTCGGLGVYILNGWDVVCHYCKKSR